MNPPNEQVEIPAEAIEAGLNVVCGVEAVDGDVEAIIQAAAPSIRQQERERLGMEECPNCDEGVVCVTGAERGPEGEAIPVPEQERCSTCGGHGFLSAFTRAAVTAATQQERERVKRELTGLHNGTAPDRDARYQDAWRHGVADALDALTTLNEETH